MNRNWDIIGDKIFGILKGSGFHLQMYDKIGNKTLDPHEANRFFATIKSHDPELEKFSILVSVHDENDASHIDIKTPKLNAQEDFDTIRRITTSIKRGIGDREGISINWYKFDHSLKPRDEAFNNITESKDISKPFGSTKSSFQKVGNSKLIIRHSDTIDESKMGSRWRHVKAIFIETKMGERFLYPHMHIAGARAMARHLSNDGGMHDEIGEAIKGLSSDYMDLKKSARMLRACGDDSKTVLLSDALHEINKQVKRLCGPKGYGQVTSTLTEKTDDEEQHIAPLLAELMDRCGCDHDDELNGRILETAARYLNRAGCEPLGQIHFMSRPDITSRVHDMPDHRERLAWQVAELAECVASDELRSRLHSVADLLKAGRVIEPRDIHLIRSVFKASRHDDNYATMPDLARIQELGGV